jgi:ribosomal protein S18 acetylase RimI-like enzyme
MAGIEIRLAVPEDAERVSLIRQTAAEEASRYRGTRLAPPLSPRDGFVLVGGAEGEVWGCLECSRVEESIWSIDRVHVLEEARDIGIGDALVRACADEVVRRGGLQLVSSAQPGDRSLKNLFERNGMVAQTILVGRFLSDPASGEDVSR